LVEFDNDGLSLRGELSIPRFTTIIVEGEVTSDGYILLQGTGTLSLGGAVTLGPVTLGFERRTDGVIRIFGSGSMSVAGITIASVAFQVGTDGSFYATGTIDLWVAKVTATIERTASGSFSLEAEVRASVSAFEHTASGVVRASYSNGVVSFFIGGGVSGPVVNFSFGLGVSSNGCFTVSPLGRYCL
jgi:hypothetical protein